MAATGKTPILLYGSTTPTNAPVAGNLTNSSDGCEIAINVADKNLFFKDSTNAVNTVPIRQSSASSNGWLSSTDWNTFNSKQPAGTYVTSVTGTAPVVSSGGTTPAISMAAANGSTSGYLTSTDWTTFNNKSPAAGSSSITTVGTITSGTWNGSAIDVAHGGTGLTSLTAGYIPYGNGTGAFSSSGNFYYNGTDLNILNGGAKVGGVIWTGGGAGFGNNGVGMWFDTGSNTGYLRSYNAGVDWRDMVYNAKTHQFQTNDNNVVKIHNSGGVSIGNTTDPGAANLSVSGKVSCSSFYSSGSTIVGFSSIPSGNTGFGSELAIFGNNGNCGLFYSNSGAGSGVPLSIARPSDGPGIYFFRNGSAAGYINITTGAISVNNSSDYRLKENVKELTGSLSKILQVRPVTFNWKENGSDGKSVIAHELQQLFPDVVFGEKDAVNEDGSIKPQSVALGNLIPDLIVAIKEQQSIINELTTRIKALEDK